MASYFGVFLPAIEGGYAVFFPDIPEAFTQGEDLLECVQMGTEVLSIAAREYAQARKDLPKPSTLDQVEAWTEAHKNNPDIDQTKKPFIQIFRAPTLI